MDEKEQDELIGICIDTKDRLTVCLLACERLRQMDDFIKADKTSECAVDTIAGITSQLRKSVEDLGKVYSLN